MAYDKYVIIYEYTAVLYSCWTFNYKVAQDLLVLGMRLVANVNLESLVCWAPVTFQVQCFFAPPSLASWYEYLYWWLCAEFSVTYSIKKNGLGYCILSREWHCWAKKTSIMWQWVFFSVLHNDQNLDSTKDYTETRLYTLCSFLTGFCKYSKPLFFTKIFLSMTSSPYIHIHRQDHYPP